MLPAPLCLVFSVLVILIAVDSCPTFTCSEHATTLSSLWSESYAENSTVCVSLNTSEELSYTDTLLRFSAVIRGNNNTVTCVEDPDVNDLHRYTHFPLRFHNASMVALMEVNFEGCKRPLQFQSIECISISSTNFTNFSIGGAVEISNSPTIYIEDSTFINDTSLGIGTGRFSGNAGGIAIGYNNEATNNTSSEIFVRRCSFINNVANATMGFFYTTLEAFKNQIYNQRGAGMALYFGKNSYTGVVNIEHCEFINNSANDSGGGIYMYLGGQGSFQDITIYNSSFVGNSALDGGGLEITYSNAESVNTPNYVNVTKCSFIRNRGKFAGGYKNIQLNDQANLNYLYVGDSIFDSNEADVGAAIYIQSVMTVRKSTLENRITMDNCIYINNIGSRGVIFILENVATIKGNTYLENNTGPGLRIIGTLVELQGNLMFKNNSNHPEGFSGALYLSSFGQIVLYPETNITFLNNRGREGACIVVKSQQISTAFKHHLYNPRCFLQYRYPTVPPPDWTVTMNFHGNEADVGPVAFLSNAAICLWSNSTSPFFFQNLTRTWQFMTMTNNYVNGKDDPTRYIQTGVYHLDLRTNKTSAYPGQMITIDAVALDEFYQPTSAFIEIGSDASDITFEPSTVPINSSNTKIEFQYRSGDNETNTNTTVELRPFFFPVEDTTNFILSHDACLPGYKNIDNECKCFPYEEVILCKENSLLLSEGYWGAPPEWSRELVYFPCPSGYCSCIGAANNPNINEGCELNFSKPEKICAKNRRVERNVLCGSCKKGYGVGLLTNTCKKYQSKIPDCIWLVPIYAIALVVSLVLLIKLGVHFPTVLRGFFFYIQVSPIAVKYFPDTFNLSTDAMSYFGSILALYIPYDSTCYKEMPSLVSYSLRYLALLIALIVVPLAARFRRHRFKYWHGIWTVILLMYVMAVETSSSILFCPELSNSTTSTTRWFFDGNVECYKNWHFPLAMLAISTLFTLALLVFVIAGSVYYKTLTKMFKNCEKLERFTIALTCGIKDEYKWWPSVELGCRFVFVVSVVLSPGTVVPLALSIVLFMLQTTIHPYRSAVANHMESLLLLWLVCFLGLGNTTGLQDDLSKGYTNVTTTSHSTQWANAMLYIPVAVGLVVLMVHSILLARKLILPHKGKIKKKLRMVFQDQANKYHDFSASYNVIKGKLSQHDGSFATTKTTVGLHDEWDEHFIAD